MAYESETEQLLSILKLRNPKIETEVRFQSNRRSFVVDLVMEDSRSIFFIEVKKKLSPDVIYRFFALKEWMSETPESNKEKIFLIAAQDIDQTLASMATLLGFRVERVFLPASELESPGSIESLKVKITADKAWKTIVSLLKYQPTSIYNVKMKSGVSYGEAHRVITYLRSRDLLTKRGNFVSVSDVRPILNAAFWERPLKSLMVKHFNIKHDSVENIPMEISELLERNNVKHAFTGIAAYGICFGGIRNESSFDLYVDISNPVFIGLMEDITTADESGIHLFLYSPDRDVFNESKKVVNTRLVGEGQLLLDLSGGDKMALQLANELVRHIGKI